LAHELHFSLRVAALKFTTSILIPPNPLSLPNNNFYIQSKWFGTRRMVSLQEEAKSTVMRHDLEVHEMATRTANTPLLAPPSKQHVGIWDIATQNDVLGRS
jgi:hypothetical protein